VCLLLSTPATPRTLQLDGQNLGAPTHAVYRRRRIYHSHRRRMQIAACILILWSIRSIVRLKELSEKHDAECSSVTILNNLVTMLGPLTIVERSQVHYVRRDLSIRQMGNAVLPAM